MPDSQHVSPLLALLPLFAACAEWPRYANLPEAPQDALAPGEEPELVTWTAGAREADPGNDSPPEVVSLEMGVGLLYYGSLQGLGWDSTQTPSHEVLCGESSATSEYPPISTGAYTGDVDWVSVSPDTTGVLCAAIEISWPDDLSDVAGYDLLLYELDSCLNPLQTFDNAQGQAIGLGLRTSEAGWEADVVEGAALGVMLAGYVPGVTLELTPSWRVGLSLVPTPEEGGLGCPDLPEEGS